MMFQWIYLQKYAEKTLENPHDSDRQLVICSKAIQACLKLVYVCLHHLPDLPAKDCQLMKHNASLIGIMHKAIVTHQETKQIPLPSTDDFTESLLYKQTFIRNMMKHAWSGYERFSFGQNELKPISRSGHSPPILGRASQVS
ncbi:hypothetical protein LOD99_9172 [Oopsacas minuta]|uniref:Uncharacterized protein n=1 Tax=Oopsacas minuta TaxID=111878 RepID=A0AAV7JDH1_9METZ|nr:hypothetical protein LOD99_9172 [Oopsacas minuta]